MEGFKFLVSILIFKLISVVCCLEDHILNLTYVCLHNSECHLTFKFDYKPEIIYIARHGQCTGPKTVGKIVLDLIELQDVPPGISQPPLKYFKAIFKVDTRESKGTICLFKTADASSPLDVRFIQFYDVSYFYSIDDNNYLGMILDKYFQENIDLVVSNKYEYGNPTNTSNFISCDDKMVSYFHLNNVIEQSKPFTDVFIFLLFKSQTTHPTFLYQTSVFNHSNILSFDHKVVDKQIIAEIKFQNPESFKQNENSLFGDNKIFLSAQSTEDIDGLESKCGGENLQWRVQNLPYKISDSGIIFLLPLDLYGKTVRICASFTVDKSEDYKIPLYSFEVNDKTSGYFKNVFYSNPLGITEIKLNSDFHPLSEIMLVHACDLVSVSVYPRSIFDTSKCYSTSDHKIANNKLLTKYNSNFSYNPEELYRSLYYKDILFDDFIPHKPVYLPDKSVVSESGTKWIKNGMFLPRLYLDNLHPYLLVACDRWKHPFCFTQDDFDSIIGIVFPSKRSFLEFTAKWENEDMIVEIKTNSSEQFLVKLIMSRNMQYTDYQSICNGRRGVYPDSYNKRSEDSWNYYKNTFKGLKLGKIYYVCLINLKVHNKLTKKFNEIYSTQGNSDYSGVDCNPKFEISWDFIGVINTQTPLSGTHFIINRHGSVSKIIFPTTGFLDESNFVRFFLSNDLSANCKILKPTELTPLTTSKNEYSSFITIVKEHYSYKDIMKESTKPEGFWLPDDGSHWISFGNYISYFGEFEQNENFYKVCACVDGACYFAGNAIESKMESFELNQIVKSNDFYDRFIYGTNICFYNRRKFSCFSQTDDLETSFKYDVKFVVPQVQINHLSFDEENEVLCLLSPNSVYVFENEPEPKIIIEGINNMEMMFSFSDVTFFVCPEHIHISVGESSIGHLISTKKAGPKLKAKETIVFSEDINKLDSIKIPVTDDINNVHIYREHDNFYSCFLINEHLFLEYYKIDIDFKNKSHFAQKIDVIDVKEYFPEVTHGVRLNVSTRLLANQEKFIIFLSHQEFDEIRVFFLVDKQIKYYSSVRSIPGTIDFITTKTHIMSLNVILFEDQFSEYVIQIEYDNLLEVTVKYPKLTELQFKNDYSFLPEVTNGVPLKFYIFEYIEDENVLEEEIQETGLKLNRKTGEIFGTSRFNGEVEVMLHVDFLLGKTTVLLKLLSRCPLGHQYSPPFRECAECGLGYYRHKLSLDTCLRCDEYMANTTTKNYGSTSPLDCVCKPGFYSSTKACLMCPEGKYNDELGAISCDKTCLPNQISSVVGASSREELKCTCVEGYFNKNGWCEECYQGTYCPGNNVVYTCPENTSTIGPGSKSINDCLCNPGYEFLEEGCKPCNIHSYKSTISNDKCTLCSADTPDDVYSYSKNPGSTSKDQCIYCMPGYYHNGKSCVHCPDKSFCKGANFAPISCGANSIVKKGI
ncbi:cysteine repeat modular protein [Theileria annulata]|uniref:Cysteine repeat modular protein homologue, putative n=1 Tax=Theileria annulata TaxID=5874 RepID=Q4UH00_THEAN|nr:cysteine repeat modular protein [Theileria annulata]CAI73639.1 cysteine repeat modular protein homologue, putative [Theileria annulata]|eukprot:XP_954316.1 cysteine repeat modular protein homologue, putative [Theileria annulata]